MQVFVLRHGQAETQQTVDEARNLTAKGRSDVAASIQASLRDMVNLQEVWASPYARAQQTARIACDVLSTNDIHPALKTVAEITPEGNPIVLFSILQASQLRSVLLVTHQPFVSNFIGDFCGGPAGPYPMDTSSLALIECDVAANSCGELRWLRHLSE